MKFTPKTLTTTVLIDVWVFTGTNEFTKIVRTTDTFDIIETLHEQEKMVEKLQAGNVVLREILNGEPA